MEVQLLETEDLPQGALLSVKVGSTRRQGPAEKDKLRLNFAKSCAPGDPVRLELLQVLAQTCVDLTNGASDGRYSVCFAKAKCNIVLGVKHSGCPRDLSATKDNATTEMGHAAVPGLEGDLEGENAKGGNQRQQTALSARTYLEQHRLLSWSQTLFSDLIRDEPASPWDYVEEHLRAVRKSEATQVPLRQRIRSAMESFQKLCSKVQAKADSLGADIGKSRQVALAEVGKKIQETTNELLWELDFIEAQAAKKSAVTTNEMESLRRLASQTLSQAAMDGRLSQVLASKDIVGVDNDSMTSQLAAPASQKKGTAPMSQIESLRALVRESLNNAVADGSLEKALEVCRDSGRSDSKDDIDSLRQMAGQTLIAASFDGRLEKALSQNRQNHGSKDDIDSLRQMAGQTLLAACSDGRLERALSQKRQNQDGKDDIDSLRQMAGQTLLAASFDGRLEKALSQTRQNRDCDDIETLRLAARKTLSEASRDGRLHKALVRDEPSVAEDDVDGLRDMVSQTLLAASIDGRLEKALSETRGKPTYDLEGLRQHVSRTLTEASRDGRLLEALQNRGAQDDLECARDDLETLRKMASQTLLSACQDGRLENALSRKKSADKIEELRKIASMTLSEASKDGRLFAALQTCKSGTSADVDVEGLRALASQVLIDASRDGRLEKVLSNSRKKTIDDEVEEVRALAKQTLIYASQDGRLERALSNKKDQKEKDAEALRDLARQTLLSASRDGRLSKALSISSNTSANATASEEAEKLEALRLFASQKLLEACSDGRLEETLSERKEARGHPEQSSAPSSTLGKTALSFATSMNPGDVASDIRNMREQTEAELQEMREHALKAKALIRDTYDVVLKDMADLRSQAHQVTQDFSELRESAKAIKELLAKRK